jgi:hypothetical protein
MSLLSEFHSLPLQSVPGAPGLATAVAAASLQDPALSQMTDLTHGPCVVADHLDGLEATWHVMLRAQVHMAFVAGVDGGIIGMVSRDDLKGEKPVQRALAAGVHHQELALEQLMTPVSAWQVLDASRLAHARVGDVVTTLREHSLRYLLVAEKHEGVPQLCGLFSARRLEMALGTAIDADLHFRSFAELESVLGSH